VTFFGPVDRRERSDSQRLHTFASTKLLSPHSEHFFENFTA